jgi:hypothetical protein
LIGGRGVPVVGLGRPLEITRPSLVAAGRGAGSSTAGGCSTTGATSTTGVSTTGSAGAGSSTGVAAFFAGAFFAAAFFAGAFFSGASSPSTGFAAAFFAGAFFAAVFFAGFSSSGWTSRFKPSRSALRRTRSAWASSIVDEIALTGTPIETDRSRASLLVRPNSFASSDTRIFLAAKG